MKTIALSAITLMALTGCQSPENNLVRLAAHDSFVIGEELVAQFESETGYELEILLSSRNLATTPESRSPKHSVARGPSNTPSPGTCKESDWKEPLTPLPWLPRQT